LTNRCVEVGREATKWVRPFRLGGGASTSVRAE